MAVEAPRITIIAAGDGGTTALAFIHASQAGLVDVQVSDVIYNNGPRDGDPNHIATHVAAVNRQYDDMGRFAGQSITLHHISNVTHPGEPGESPAMITDQASEAMSAVLRLSGATLGVMLGYRKQIRGLLLEEWAANGRLTNNHPGPTENPAFRGLWGHQVHEKAHELLQTEGLEWTALTIQRVAPDYDEGAPIAVIPVPLLRGDTPDTIASRVQATERVWTPLIIGKYALSL